MNNDQELETKSQSQMIYEYLNYGLSLSAMEALDLFGCSRLAARIHELRLAGHNVGSRMVRTGSGRRVARYSLDKGGDHA